MSRRYRMHGLLWDSEVDLHVPAVDDDGPPDFRLRVGECRPAPQGVPAGEVLALLRAQEAGRDLYSLVRDRRGLQLTFHDLCSFRISADLTTGTFHPVSQSHLAYGQVFATGTLVSTLLMLGGQPVLHGSAVQDGATAVAFVGASGMGKTTLSALLARQGAGLLTDDVLVVQRGGEGYVCRRGAAESRLRPGAAYLADGSSRPTPDGRSAYRPLHLGQDRVPLRVLAVPYPSRSLQQVQVEWLDQRAALLELLRFPRIVGWREPATTAAHFALLGDLARRVPVARLRVPWSDNLDGSVARQVREALRLET